MVKKAVIRPVHIAGYIPLTSSAPSHRRKEWGRLLHGIIVRDINRQWPVAANRGPHESRCGAPDGGWTEGGDDRIKTEEAGPGKAIQSG